MASQTDTDVAVLSKPEAAPTPYRFDALDEWLLATLDSNDPINLRHAELTGWADAAGFKNIDLRNLSDDSWVMRFTPGTSACTTAADAERLVGFIARACRCRIEPHQMVTIMLGDQIAGRFTLQPYDG
jgi:hypothetical protein